VPDILAITRASSFRIALLYLALFLASVGLVLGVTYRLTLSLIDQHLEDSIGTEVEGLADLVRARGVPGLAAVISERVAQPTNNALYVLALPTLQPIAGNLSAWPVDKTPDDGWLVFTLKDRAGVTMAARARAYTLTGGMRLLVGRDLRDRDAFVRRLGIAMAWAVAGTLVLGIGGATLLARRALRRVEIVASSLDRIIDGDLAARLPSSNSGDEIDRLVVSVNTTLDRLEALMAGLRRISHGVAHELRTPVVRLRGRLEMALMHDLPVEALRGEMERAVADADALLAMVRAMLDIAEAEAGLLRDSRAAVDVSRLAVDAAELYAPAAEEAGLTLKTAITGGLKITGHAQLLARAISNLLDNAVKYTPSGGCVVLGVAALPTGGVRLWVQDTGPGIPADRRSEALEPFVRVREPGGQPGVGLGLALVRAIAKAHGARLSLDDAAPGLRVTLELVA
jgi:signal transduction histidine kinase